MTPARSSASRRPATPRTRRWLATLNFFVADIQAIAPFFSVFLLAHGWHSGAIGTVMSVGALTGVMLATPAGGLVDHTRHKRACVALSCGCTIAASALVVVSQDLWVVVLSQIATAAASALIIPAIAGITLGIVRQKGFNRQQGINQAFTHAGNMVGAGLSGLLGWAFGLPFVFLLGAVFAVMSIVAVTRIERADIDDHEARGLKEEEPEGKPARGHRALLESKPLVVLGAALALFNLGNAAILPLYGLAVVSLQGEPARWVSTAVVVSQLAMIGVALLAPRLAEWKGYWLVMLIAFASLPVRGLVASQLISGWGVFPVQLLDGLGSGLQTVAVPALVARLLAGTGRVNLGQGTILALQGIGSSLSPALGGWIAQAIGYSSTFLVVPIFGLGSIALWLAFASTLRSACGLAETPSRRGKSLKGQERPA